MSQSKAIVMSRRSVHLTTIFLGKLDKAKRVAVSDMFYCVNWSYTLVFTVLDIDAI